MSKMTKALNKVAHERDLKAGFLKSSSVRRNKPIRSMEEGEIKNPIFVWIFLIGIIIAVFVVFNMKNGQDAVSLTEIFPEEVYPIDVEYEFVDKDAEIKNIVENKKKTSPIAVKQESVKTSLPVVKEAVSQTASAVQKEVKPVEAAVTVQPVYTIQVASFKDEQKAKVKVEELLKKDYPAFILSRNLGDKGTWYRVYVGRFEQKSAADTYLKKVQVDYKDSFIISPKK